MHFQVSPVPQERYLLHEVQEEKRRRQDKAAAEAAAAAAQQAPPGAWVIPWQVSRYSAESP